MRSPSYFGLAARTRPPRSSDELVDDAVIVGDIDHVRKQMAVWEAAGVTMMVVTAGSAEQVRDLAALV